MCGLIFGCNCAAAPARALAVSHRGPDAWIAGNIDGYFFAFNRLVVNGCDNYLGMQPISNVNGVLLANAEVYKKLTTAKTDCVILRNALETQQGFPAACAAISKLTAEFALVWRCILTGSTVVARDKYGVRPLYRAQCALCNKMSFASEASALRVSNLKNIEQVPPGGLLIYTDDGSQPPTTLVLPPSPNILRSGLAFQCAVGSRLLGCPNSADGAAILLSGGLDSTAVAYAASLVKFAPVLHAVTFYYDDQSPDLVAARAVAKELNMPLTEIKVQPTLDDACRAAQTLSTYDITTVRAGTLQLAALKELRRLKPNLKVLLAGEGADEALGGYQYFKHAPSADEAADECQRLLAQIHKFDGLRVDRAAGQFGFEVRLPFLDSAFVGQIQSVSPAVRFPPAVNGLTKAWFREELMSALPQMGPAVKAVVSGRHKDALSDACGYSWVDYLAEASSAHMPATPSPPIGWPVPLTPEAAQYYAAYVDYFGVDSPPPIPHYWMPRWCDAADPSARTSLRSYTNQ